MHVASCLATCAWKTKVLGSRLAAGRSDLFVFLSVCLSACLSVCLSVCLYIYLSINSSIHSLNHLFIYISIYREVTLSTNETKTLQLNTLKLLTLTMNIFYQIPKGKILHSPEVDKLRFLEKKTAHFNVLL